MSALLVQNLRALSPHGSSRAPACEQAFSRPTTESEVAPGPRKVWGTRECFPYPHEPRYVLDALRGGGFPQDGIDLAYSYSSADYKGSTAITSLLMAKHWASLSEHLGDRC